jgi:hypothetical protein
MQIFSRQVTAFSTQQNLGMSRTTTDGTITDHKTVVGGQVLASGTPLRTVRYRNACNAGAGCDS